MPATRHRVDSRLRVFALTALLSIPALSCGGGDNGDPPIVEPEQPRVNSVVVTPSSLSFDALGDTSRLSASVLDQYGQPMPGASILWVSGDGNIASVDQAGLVRSVRNGHTSIRAVAGLRRDTIQVTVAQTPHSLAIEAGNNQAHWTGFTLRDTLRVLALDRRSNPVPGREVTWEVTVGGGAVEQGVTLSDSTGRASNRWVLGDTATGTQQVSASVPNLSPVFFQAAGAAPISVLNPGALSALMLDTLLVTILALDSLGKVQAGIPVQFSGLTGFGEMVQGPTTTDVRGELAARWVLGPTPGSQTVLATRADMERAVMVEAQGTGLLDAWPFTSVATGFSHTCGIDGDGTAYCWGRGDNHRLGTGETVSVSAPVPVASALSWTRISAGRTHSCALGGPGAQIHCWGQGLQTGQGGNQIVPTPLPVPGGPWASLTAGDTHECAVATNGAGYCWGEGQYGRLGTGSSTSTGDPSLISGGRAWTQLSAGRFHTCGVTTSGQAYCWGRGAEGQLGSGTTQEALTPVLVAGGFQWQSVSAGWAHSCGITVDGDAFCWGEGSSNELGNGSAVDQTSPVKVAGNRTWRAVSAGERHSCGIDADKKLHCWGAGGMVGLGTAGSGAPALLAQEDDWESVHTLYRHTCAVTSDARTFCWGINDYGQLGIRTTTSSNILRLVFRGVIRP
jgi:alpha-tubulin suppressor-like RCC1 family protein